MNKFFVLCVVLAMVAMGLTAHADESPKDVEQKALKANHINTDATPFIPKGWTVEQHRKSGQLAWNSEVVKLYLSEKQKRGGKIQGHELRKEIEGRPVMNACVLDWLLVNQELIPKGWQDKEVPFWGTIYRDLDSHLAVRYLSWNGEDDVWVWNYRWLDDRWYDRHPAAFVEKKNKADFYKKKSPAPPCEACDGD